MVYRLNRAKIEPVVIFSEAVVKAARHALDCVGGRLDDWKPKHAAEFLAAFYSPLTGVYSRGDVEAGGIRLSKQIRYRNEYAQKTLGCRCCVVWLWRLPGEMATTIDPSITIYDAGAGAFGWEPLRDRAVQSLADSQNLPAEAVERCRVETEMLSGIDWELVKLVRGFEVVEFSLATVLEMQSA